MSETHDPTLAQVIVHLEYLRDDVSEIKTAVREQNGRVRKLEERVTEINAEAKTAGRNHGATWGAILGGVIAGIWSAVTGGR